MHLLKSGIGSVRKAVQVRASALVSVVEWQKAFLFFFDEIVGKLGGLPFMQAR